MTPGLQIARGESCWTFTLDRPEKMNALGADLVEGLLAGIEEADASDIPVLAFRGNGKNFSAGFDFADLDRHSDGDLLMRFVRIEMLLQAVASSPATTIALAHGRNFGAAVDLFAVCKLRVCSADATFRMPGLRFGLVLGSRRFAELVGHAVALEVLEQAQVIEASRAVAIGLATRLLGSQEWPDLIASAQVDATALDSTTRRLLCGALAPTSLERDLAWLVRSAARPGLKHRITEYLRPESR